MVAGPVVVALVAAVIGRYPFSVRLVLFLVPSLVILVASGLATILAPFRQRRILASVVGAALTAPLLFRGLFFTPAAPSAAPEEIRSVVTRFLERHRPGDAIYLRAGAVPAWTFYTTDWASPDRARLSRYARIDRSDHPAFENSARRGHPVRTEEAKELSFVYRDWREVIGLPAGIERHSTPKLLSPEPDPEWARVEAERIRTAAQPEVWLCFSHYSHDARAEARLLEAVEALGGRRLAAWYLPGAALYQYAFR
ncbi:MAG: hypothetical protein ABI766_10605 [Gemmatimonadales bacterium]